MNNNLLDTLKRLLADSIAPQDMHHFDDKTISLEVNTESKHQKLKKVPEIYLRILRTEELKQFTNEGISYFYFIDKLELVTTQLREELLNTLLSTKQDITPHAIKTALLNMLGQQMSDLERLFLDFTLTPTLSAKH